MIFRLFKRRRKKEEKKTSMWSLGFLWEKYIPHFGIFSWKPLLAKQEVIPQNWYQEALRDSGYDYRLKFELQNGSSQRKREQRQAIKPN